MTFTSDFFLFGLLPWFLGLFYLLRRKTPARKILLFLANSVFYLWGGIGAYLFLCGFAAAVWALGQLVGRCKNRAVFAGALTLTLLPLLFSKYTGFLLTNLNAVFGCGLTLPAVWMPIGISFFTFQALSLLCDRFQGKIEGRLSLPDVFLYLTFFATVTSGPIVRFSAFREGLYRLTDANAPDPSDAVPPPHDLRATSYAAAIERIAIGLCKKVLIADKLAFLADYYFNGVADGKSFSCLGLWIGSFAYTLQLYYDFSGYSDMAIGIGQMLGFRLPENFNRPYQTTSLTGFWRRWHISLSSWFRDYIYIPLGGSRCSAGRHICNLAVVWLLTGIWHGAGWTFLLWGVAWFVLLVAEKYIPALQRLGRTRFGHLHALFWINLFWIPFRAQDLPTALRYLGGLFGLHASFGIESRALSFLPFLAVAAVLCFPLERISRAAREKPWLSRVRTAALWLATFLALCAVLNASYTPYIYGNF